MKSFNRTLLLITCFVGLLAFFTGFVYDRHLKERFHDTFIQTFKTKRDFEYCDRSWHDLDEEYSTIHNIAVDLVNEEEIDRVFK